MYIFFVHFKGCCRQIAYTHILNSKKEKKSYIFLPLSGLLHLLIAAYNIFPVIRFLRIKVNFLKIRIIIALIFFFFLHNL